MINDFIKATKRKVKKTIQKQVQKAAPIVTEEVKKIASLKVQATKNNIIPIIKVAGMVILLIGVVYEGSSSTVTKDILDAVHTINISTADTYNFYYTIK